MRRPPQKSKKSRQSVACGPPGEYYFAGSEICGFDLLVGGQFFAGTLHENGPGLHDVGPVRDFERHICVLLNEQTP